MYRDFSIKKQNKKWGPIDNTFSYQKIDNTISLRFDNDRHTIKISDTIVLDSCYRYIQTKHQNDSSYQIELISSCKYLIPASPEIFDKVFGTSQWTIRSLADLPYDYVHLTLCCTQSKNNTRTYQYQNQDTLFIEKFEALKNRKVISTIYYNRSTKEEPYTYEIAYDRNSEIKKITLSHFAYNANWKIRYLKNNLIQLKTNYYDNYELTFFIQLPPEIKFSDLILNKHNLFYWDTISHARNMSFWLMVAGEPPSFSN